MERNLASSPQSVPGTGTNRLMGRIEHSPGWAVRGNKGNRHESGGSVDFISLWESGEGALT